MNVMLSVLGGGEIRESLLRKSTVGVHSILKTNTVVVSPGVVLDAS